MDTVREAIEAAVKQHEEPVTEVLAPEVTIGEVEPEVKERERDEHGKFKKKEESEPVEVKTEPVTETPAIAPETPNEEQAIPEAEPDVIKPPRALAAHLKAVWSDLDPAVKKEFVRLEENSFKGVAGLQEDAKVGKSLMNEIRPFEHLIAAAGGTPETAIRNLLQTAAIFRTGTAAEKQRAVVQIIQEYGIDMGQIPQQQQTDPLYNRVQQLEQQLHQTQQQRIQQEESERVNAVTSFLEEVDTKGNQKYPLDENLEQIFYHEIAAVRKLNPNANYRDVLEKSYENVSWKVPEIREVKLAQQQAEAEAKRKEKEAQELAKKKGAAVSVTGAASPNANSTEPSSLRDLIASQVYGDSKRI